jgi:hypothetical protein
MGYDMSDAYKICGFATPSVSDVEAWNMLDGGDSNSSELRVGLFGYDISCLASMCAQPHADDSYYCDFIAARGLDGLAFGVQFKIDSDATNYYCAGFHREESFDHFVCGYTYDGIENYYFPQNYTVTADHVAGTGIDNFESTENGYYGFSEFLFQYS